MERLSFLDKMGDRWWPLMAGVYLVVAKKRVAGMTPLRVEWKREKVVGRFVASPSARIRRQSECARDCRAVSASREALWIRWRSLPTARAEAIPGPEGGVPSCVSTNMKRSSMARSGRPPIIVWS